MVASAVFITDLQGKGIISRDYRGDVPITKAIEVFTKYLGDVEDDQKKPIFQIDPSGDIISNMDDVGSTGVGGETFIYIQVCCHKENHCTYSFPDSVRHLYLTHTSAFCFSLCYSNLYSAQ